MVKQKYNVDVIEFAEWMVVLEKLTNTASGCPRYKATIIYCGADRGMDRAGHVFQFTGHYRSERQEAEYILQYYLEKEGII